MIFCQKPKKSYLLFGTIWSIFPSEFCGQFIVSLSLCESVSLSIILKQGIVTPHAVRTNTSAQGVVKPERKITKVLQVGSFFHT